MRSDLRLFINYILKSQIYRRLAELNLLKGGDTERPLSTVGDTVRMVICYEGGKRQLYTESGYTCVP